MKRMILILMLILVPTIIGNHKVESVFKVTPIKIEDKIIMDDTEEVTLTIYSPTEEQTDSSPNITASGFKINMNDPGSHKIIAVSRDLKLKWKFKQKVIISNAGKYDGIYVIEDLMNKRYTNRIDILVGEDEPLIKLSGVKIKSIN
jgi:3D (Asp-Asp-Asp) domain-containing protein